MGPNPIARITDPRLMCLVSELWTTGVMITKPNQVNNTRVIIYFGSERCLVTFRVILLIICFEV